MACDLEQLKAGVETNSPESCEAVAAAFAGLLPEDAIVKLRGDLGAGKTTFVRGLARAWGIVEPVTSPTFNLFSIYQGSRQLVHVDAYRLTHSAEADGLLIDEFLQPPFCLAIEWPERLSLEWTEPAWDLRLGITPQRTHLIRLESWPES